MTREGEGDWHEKITRSISAQANAHELPIEGVFATSQAPAVTARERIGRTRI